MSDYGDGRRRDPTHVSVDGLPVILVVISLFRASQEPTIQESIKLRHQLETLAGETAQLAADGDVGARAVVEEMKKQGMSLNPPKKE